MKLKPADIDRITEGNIPRAQRITSAEDFVDSNADARDALIQSLTTYKSQSSARIGEVLPPPPKSLRTEITGANDFGIIPNSEQDLDSSSLSQGSVESDHAPLTNQLQIRSNPALPLALRNVDLDKIESRADLIMALTNNLPLNDMQLPRILYRGDLLDWRLFSGNSSDQNPTDRYQAMQEYLDAATLHIQYHEGFPALQTGEPLWAKLPFESQEHYNVFTAYCTMPGARQTQKLINLTKGDHNQILTWFHEHYWNIRSRCYDMLNVIHAAKQREQRILACEDDHYLQAENMFKRLVNMLPEVEWDHLRTDPEKFISVLEKVIKLQRVSLGLSSMGNVNDKREPRTESLEITMRKIAAPNNLQLNENDGGVSLDIKQLLKDPGALSTAQELIIRMTKSTQDA